MTASPPYRDRLQRAAAVARDLLVHSRAKRWELFAKASYTREVELAAGQPEQVIETQEMGVGVRISSRSTTGFAAASGLETAAARNAIDGAFACEIKAPFDPIPPPHLLGTATPPPPRALPADDWALDANQRLCAAMAAIRSGLQVQRTVFQEGVFTWLLTTGEGFVTSFEESSSSLLVEVVMAGEGTGIWREWLHIRDPHAFEPEALAQQIGNRILLTRSPVVVDTGLKDVLLHGEVSAHLLAALVPLFLATPEAEDRLPAMLNREGELASPALTLIDHRADATAPVHGPCDGEGLPSRRLVLLEAGVPRHRLASYRDAMLCDEAPGGGALRLSYRDYPSTGIAGLQVVTEHGSTPAQMLADTDRALYLLRPLAPVVLDAANDTYRLVASGVWLESGRIRGWHPVVELRGGIGQLLRRIDTVGTDLSWYQTEQGFVRAPSMLLRRQQVVG